MLGASYVSLLVLLLTLLLVAACPSSRDTVFYEGAGPYPVVSESGFASARARATETYFRKCCELAGLSHPGGHVTVRKAPHPSSGARFDRAAASACLAELTRGSCRMRKEPASIVEACEHVYERGSFDEGHECVSDWECAAPDAPDWSNCVSFGESIGVCAVTKGAGEDEACGSVGVQCVWPLVCDGRVCVTELRRPELGESCPRNTVEDPCAEGAVCSADGVCVEPVPVGETCAHPQDCEGFACVAGRCREAFDVVRACEP